MKLKYNTELIIMVMTVSEIQQTCSNVFSYEKLWAQSTGEKFTGPTNKTHT